MSLNFYCCIVKQLAIMKKFFVKIIKLLLFVFSAGGKFAFGSREKTLDIPAVHIPDCDYQKYSHNVYPKTIVSENKKSGDKHYN